MVNMPVLIFRRFIMKHIILDDPEVHPAGMKMVLNKERLHVGPLLCPMLFLHGIGVPYMSQCGSVWLMLRLILVCLV